VKIQPSHAGLCSSSLLFPQPIEETLRHPGFEARNLVYEHEAKARVPIPGSSRSRSSAVQPVGRQSTAPDSCLAHPGSNVLIVACEFRSLCYQPTDLAVSSLFSNGKKREREKRLRHSSERRMAIISARRLSEWQPKADAADVYTL